MGKTVLAEKSQFGDIWVGEGREGRAGGVAEGVSFCQGRWQRAADILRWYKNHLVPQEGAIKGGV